MDVQFFGYVDNKRFHSEKNDTTHIFELIYNNSDKISENCMPISIKVINIKYDRPRFNNYTFSKLMINIFNNLTIVARINSISLL